MYATLPLPFEDRVDVSHRPSTQVMIRKIITVNINDAIESSGA